MDWTEHKAVTLSIRILSWVMAVALAYQGAVITWMIIDQPTLVLPEAKKGQRQAQMSGGNTLDIASWSLFGEASDAPIEVQQVETAVATQLRLVLLGVFTSPQGESGSAIIAEKGREGQFFKIGDRVQGSTRLVQVYEDKVILNNRGKNESLSFDDASKAAAAGFSSQKTKPSKSKRATNNSTDRRAFQDRVRKIRTPEDFVSFARDELEADPQAAMQNVGLKPADNGYEVMSNATMLMSLGMKPGDKLISINGQSLGDPIQDKNLIDEVYAQGSARIEVERGGTRFTINHQFK